MNVIWGIGGLIIGVTLGVLFNGRIITEIGKLRAEILQKFQEVLAAIARKV